MPTPRTNYNGEAADVERIERLAAENERLRAAIKGAQEAIQQHKSTGASMDFDGILAHLRDACGPRDAAPRTTRGSCATQSKKPKGSARRCSWKHVLDECSAFAMQDRTKDRRSYPDRNRDEARQLLKESGEPAPVDLEKFRKRVGEIIARAMQAFRGRDSDLPRKTPSPEDRGLGFSDSSSEPRQKANRGR
jgi:hypothetical protein